MLSHRSLCHVDVKPHVRRHEIMAECSHKCCQTTFRSLRRVEDPTTARHRAITSERRRLANCPLWCQPCRHGDRLDQQEGMAIVLDVLRQRRSAGNTNALSPCHTLLSASIRSWLSMSGNQNHDSPLCNLVHLGSARRRHVIFVLESAECKSNLPEKPCALPSTTERFSFERELFKLVLVQRGCQIARAEKGNEMSCVTSADKNYPSNVRDPEETVPPRPLLANTRMTKEKRKITRLPTCGGSQLTNEDIREYLSSSCAQFTI